LGRSRGGFGTKLHLVGDGRGIPLGATISAGRRHESIFFEQLMDTERLSRRRRPEPVSGHGVGRWCRETSAAAIRGVGRGCVGDASRASSRRVPIRLRSPSTTRRTEAEITSSDASAGSSTAAASRPETTSWRAAFSPSSRWP
jgi:hypothetical protein